MMGISIQTLLRTAATPFAVSVLTSTMVSFVAGPYWPIALLIGGLILIGWTAAMFVSIVSALFCRTWIRAALPACALVLSVPSALIGLLSGDYVHLALMYPSYAAEIFSQPDWQSRPFRFGWGDEAVSVLDGIRIRVLIYDASGKTVVGDASNSERALTRDIHHMVGNFYLARYHSG